MGQRHSQQVGGEGQNTPTALPPIEPVSTFAELANSGLSKGLYKHKLAHQNYTLMAIKRVRIIRTQRGVL